MDLICFWSILQYGVNGLVSYCLFDLCNIFNHTNPTILNEFEQIDSKNGKLMDLY